MDYSRCTAPIWCYRSHILSVNIFSVFSIVLDRVSCTSPGLEEEVAHVQY